MPWCGSGQKVVMNTLDIDGCPCQVAMCAPAELPKMPSIVLNDGKTADQDVSDEELAKRGENLDKVKEGAKEIAEGIKGGAKVVGEAIKEGAEGAGEKAKSYWQRFKEWMSSWGDARQIDVSDEDLDKRGENLDKVKEGAEKIGEG